MQNICSLNYVQKAMILELLLIFILQIRIILHLRLLEFLANMSARYLVSGRM